MASSRSRVITSFRTEDNSDFYNDEPKHGVADGQAANRVPAWSRLNGVYKRDRTKEYQLSDGAILYHGTFAAHQEIVGELVEDHISLNLGETMMLRDQRGEGEMRAGDVAIGPAGLRYSTSWSKPAQFLTLVCGRATLARAARDLGIGVPPELRIARQQEPHIERILRSLHEDLAEGKPNGPLYSDLLLLALAVRAIRSFNSVTAKTRIYRNGLSSSKLRQLVTYVDEHYAEPIRLADLAARADMSPHYFCQLFKQSTGQSPHQYLMERRIEHAKRMLREGRMTLAEIAYRTGFSSQAHFTGAFRRWAGVTPGEYRARFKT